MHWSAKPTGSSYQRAAPSVERVGVAGSSLSARDEAKMPSDTATRLQLLLWAHAGLGHPGGQRPGHQVELHLRDLGQALVDVELGDVDEQPPEPVDRALEEDDLAADGLATLGAVAHPLQLGDVLGAQLLPRLRLTGQLLERSERVSDRRGDELPELLADLVVGVAGGGGGQRLRRLASMGGAHLLIRHGCPLTLPAQLHLAVRVAPGGVVHRAALRANLIGHACTHWMSWPSASCPRCGVMLSGACGWTARRQARSP